MARNVWEIPINDETSDEDLERCILTAVRTSDPNVLRAAANATAQKARNERAEWTRRFELQSRERVNSLRAQEAQMERQMDRQSELADQQLVIAEQQAASARSALNAVWIAAGATAILAFLAAVQLFKGLVAS